MSSLVQLATQVLSATVRSAQVSAHSGEFRVLFSGLPRNQLLTIWRHIAEGGGGLPSPTGVIPVYLVDEGPNERIGLCRRCRWADVIDARNNSSISRLIVLRFHADTVPGSISSAFTECGQADPIRDRGRSSERADVWLSRNPLLRHAFEMAGAALSKAWAESSETVELLRSALADVSELDGLGPEGIHEQQWALIERLLSAATVSPGTFAATLGFPPTRAGVPNARLQRTALAKLADALHAGGVRTGLDALAEKADAPSQALRALKDHLGPECDGARFKASPTAYYRCIEATPVWWTELDAETLLQLLEGDEPEEDTPLEVEVSADGFILRPAKGAKYWVTRGTARFQLFVPNPETGGRVPAPSETLAATKATRTYARSSVDVPFDGDRWLDDDPPLHARPIGYSFSHPEFAAASCRLVVLERYKPGFVVRATAAKKLKDARRARRREEADWISSMDFAAAGTHQIELYFDTDRVRVADAFLAGAGTSLKRRAFETEEGWSPVRVHPLGPGRALLQLPLDANSAAVVRLARVGSDDRELLLLDVSVGTQTAAHSTSVFDALVSKNRELGKRPHDISVRSSELHAWLRLVLDGQEDPEQLIVGAAFSTDFETAPEPGSHGPLRSTRRFVADPRPVCARADVPEGFAAARSTMHAVLRQMLSDSQVSHLEELDLWLIARDAELAATLREFVHEYTEWCRNDGTTASWYEVYGLFLPEGRSAVLEPEPTMVLVSPLHPLRLAWLVLAQDRLRGALDAGTPCPFPSVLDPSSAPDVLLLGCATGTDRSTELPFISVSVSGDYWGALWHASHLDRLRNPEILATLSTLGLHVEGLSTGMAEGQVSRAMSDLDGLACAQSVLRVGLASSESGSQACTTGLAEWCQESLGDQDPWNSVSGRRLVILDHRGSDLPEHELVANLSHATGGAVEWYRRDRERRANAGDAAVDLAILSHLGMLNPRLVNSDTRSALSEGALLRHRVRRNHLAGDDIFVVESRVASSTARSGVAPLFAATRRLARAIESRVGGVGFQYAPNWAALDDAVSTARYCAVAASDTDPSGFSRPDTGTYLWDYDVPALARHGIQDSGYYLVSRQEDEAVSALRAGFEQLRSDIELSEDAALALLAGVSNRGIPSLKQFFAGGSAAAGEVGVLAALQLLQPTFGTERAELPSVFPPVDGSAINLLIPVDPFRDQLSALRKALCPKSSAARPDLLAVSIEVPEHPNAPIAIHITPIEVKCRGHAMSGKEQEKARSQNLAMIELLDALVGRSFGSATVSEESQEPTMWELAGRALLAAWLDFGFRVYARGCPALSATAWTEAHERVVGRLLEGIVRLEIARVGRVITVHGGLASGQRDHDGDGFAETFELRHADAARMLAFPDDRQTLCHRAFELVGDWNLTVDLSESSSADPGGEDAMPAIPPGIGREGGTAGVEEAAIAVQKQGIRFPVGTTTRVLQPRPVFFHPSNTELSHLNVGIVGDMGTGKTQLTKYIITRMCLDARGNRGRSPRFLIFDYKKDYSKRDFVSAVGARLVPPEDIPLNILTLPPREDGAPHGRRDWVKRANFLYDALNRIYGGIGPVQRGRLKASVIAAYEAAAPSGRAPVLSDVFDHYDAAGKPDSVSSILSDLVDMGIFTDDPDDVVEFDDFLDGVTVVQLNMLGADQQLKNSLVVFFLSMFYDFMIRLEKAPFAGHEPQLRLIEAMLLVDEADNIMKYDFDILRQVLQEGREFGVGVLLASQYLSHFRRGDYDYREPLLTWFVHRVPGATPKDLHGLGLASVDPETVARIKSLEKHEYFCTTLGEAGTFATGQTFWRLHEEAWAHQHPAEWERLRALHSAEPALLAAALEAAMLRTPPDISTWFRHTESEDGGSP